MNKIEAKVRLAAAASRLQAEIDNTVPVDSEEIITDEAARQARAARIAERKLLKELLILNLFI
jgi:hypothetical protein